MAVDSRPIAERGVRRALFLVACVVAGCTLLGGGSAAYVLVYLTRPKESR